MLSEGKRGPPVDEGGEGMEAAVRQSNLVVEENRLLFHQWV